MTDKLELLILSPQRAILHVDLEVSIYIGLEGPIHFKTGPNFRKAWRENKPIKLKLKKEDKIWAIYSIETKLM